jgi:beta-1,4-mannosyl-glycoprotein beta-1,4-N-acetylglucosaminyltransferase
MAKIFDCFTFFRELDILDARLSELAKIVDHFVIVEATHTFQGDPKPLYFADNARRFAAYADKIIHVVIEFPNDIQPRKLHDWSPAWRREFYQRDQIVRGLSSAGPADLVIVSDVDEILRANKLNEAIQTRQRYDLTIFEMPIHLFFVNRVSYATNPKAPDIRWLGPRMIEKSKLSTPQLLRECKLFVSRSLRGTLLGRLQTQIQNYFERGISGRPFLIRDAGWHLTAIGSWRSWQEKIAACCHREDQMRLDAFHDEKAFFQSMREWTRDALDPTLPRFILENPDRFPIAL